jgi:hypothetical protein
MTDTNPIIILTDSFAPISDAIAIHTNEDSKALQLIGSSHKDEVAIRAAAEIPGHRK